MSTIYVAIFYISKLDLPYMFQNFGHEPPLQTTLSVRPMWQFSGPLLGELYNDSRNDYNRAKWLLDKIRWSKNS